MKLFDKRSREEAEAESGIRIQMLKNKAQQYASKCDAIAATYDKKAADAAQIHNEPLFKVFQEKSNSLKTEAQKIRSFLLIVSDMEMMKDQSSVLSSFSDAMETFVRTFSGSKIRPSWMSTVEGELEKAKNQSERIGDLFSGFLEDVGTTFPEHQETSKTQVSDPSKTGKDLSDLEDRLKERLRKLGETDEKE